MLAAVIICAVGGRRVGWGGGEGVVTEQHILILSSLKGDSSCQWVGHKLQTCCAAAVVVIRKFVGSRNRPQGGTVWLHTAWLTSRRGDE